MTKPPPLTATGEPRAFFGRRSGKRLHTRQDRLFREKLPALEIALGDGPVDPSALFPGLGRFAIEIGYGGGEHLVRQALTHPDIGFIGCEVFSGGIAKMIEAVAAEDVRNVRLFTDDALKLLVKLPDASLDAAYLLYPDPWPKTRHHKRRFISPTTLAQLGRVLKTGTTLYFATDIEDYANWALAHILRDPMFRFEPKHPGIWHDPWSGWVPTRYEEKARLEGRARSFYFAFIRQ